MANAVCISTDSHPCLAVRIDAKKGEIIRFIVKHGTVLYTVSNRPRFSGQTFYLDGTIIHLHGLGENEDVMYGFDLGKGWLLTEPPVPDDVESVEFTHACYATIDYGSGTPRDRSSHSYSLKDNRQLVLSGNDIILVNPSAQAAGNRRVRLAAGLELFPEHCKIIQYEPGRLLFVTGQYLILVDPSQLK